MARIRTIKPEFWTDEKIVVLSHISRLFFIGLWNFVDDEGRAPLSPVRLKMQILPADNADISEILGEIRRQSLVTIYVVDGKEYIQVNGFTKHQKVDKRTASKHPAPPKSVEPSRNVPLDQGREGIKEGNGNAAPGGARSPSADLIPATTAEADLFRRGKEVLGQKAGGLISQLVKAKGGNISLARAAIEMAATKNDAREYIGGVIRNRDPPERDQTIDPRLS